MAQWLRLRSARSKIRIQSEPTVVTLLMEGPCELAQVEWKIKNKIKSFQRIIPAFNSLSLIPSIISEKGDLWRTLSRLQLLGTGWSHPSGAEQGWHFIRSVTWVGHSCGLRRAYNDAPSGSWETVRRPAFTANPITDHYGGWTSPGLTDEWSLRATPNEPVSN